MVGVFVNTTRRLGESRQQLNPVRQKSLSESYTPCESKITSATLPLICGRPRLAPCPRCGAGGPSRDELFRCAVLDNEVRVISGPEFMLVLGIYRRVAISTRRSASNGVHFPLHRDGCQSCAPPHRGRAPIKPARIKTSPSATMKTK
jgi:hypothetical protein